MAKNQFDEGTAQTKWAYFRFAIVGPLLTSPPSKKELSKALQALADKNLGTSYYWTAYTFFFFYN